MVERIYVLNIYIDGTYQGTIKIPAPQLETGQFDADVEYALSRMGKRAKPTAIHLLKQLKRDNVNNVNVGNDNKYINNVNSEVEKA